MQNLTENLDKALLHLSHVRSLWLDGIDTLTLLSSNQNKLAEFTRFKLPSLAIAKGPDLRELDHSPYIVAAHKACQSGNLCLIDDTLLEIDGQPIVDIRYCMDNLSNYIGKPAKWIVNLAFAYNEFVYVFSGETSGKIVIPSGTTGFGFDPFFEPDNTPGQTLASLEDQGQKDNVSARKKATNNLLAHHPVLINLINDTLKIDGPWQTD